MARRRMIDPGLWTSEHNQNLIFRQRLLFIGLISNADDEGRVKGNPNFIRAVVFPYDDIPTPSMEKDLQAIENEGMIYRYNHDGVNYIQLRKWDEYQTINRPYPSKIPEYVSHSLNDSLNGSMNDSRLNKDKINKDKISKVKRKKKENIYSSSFLKFWDKYPRKQGKSLAFKSFKKCEVELDVLITAIEQQIKSDQWVEGFIPNPATWLNQGRWDDEVFVKPEKETEMEKYFREKEEK